MALSLMMSDPAIKTRSMMLQDKPSADETT
jgi:hypothetical protein